MNYKSKSRTSKGRSYSDEYKENGVQLAINGNRAVGLSTVSSLSRGAETGKRFY